MTDTQDTFKKVRNDLKEIIDAIAPAVEDIDFSHLGLTHRKIVALVARMDALLGIDGLSAAEADSFFGDELKAIFGSLYDRQNKMELVQRMSYWIAFRIVGYLQLAYRHPGLDDIHRQEIRHYAQQLLPIGSLPPRFEHFLAMGWDENLDVRQQ